MSRLSRNIVYNAAGQIAMAAISLVAIKYMFSRLGADAFGLVTVALVWNAVVTSALELGVASVMIREIARSFPSDRAYAVALARTSATLYWSLCGVLAVIAYVGAPWVFGSWLHTSTIDSGQAILSLRILAISGLLGLPRTMYNSVLRGLEEMGSANLLEVAARIAQSVGIVAIVVSGAGLVAVSVWIAAVYGLGLVVYAVLIGRSLPFRALLPGWAPAVLRRNAGFAAGTAVISVTAVAQIQVDKVVLSRTVAVADVGFYAVGAGLLGRAQLLVLAVAEAGLPSLTKALSDPSMWRRRYEKLHDLVVYATLPAFALLLLALGPLFTYLFGGEAADRLALPMGLLALGMYLNATLTVPYMLTIAMGRSRITAQSNALAMVVVLPVVILLIVRVGLVGAGASWLLFDIWGFVYLLPRICAQCLDQPVRTWFVRMSRALPGLLVYAAAWYVTTYRTALSPAWAAVVAVVATASYVPIALVAMGGELRATLRGNGASLLGSMRGRAPAERVA